MHNKLISAREALTKLNIHINNFRQNLENELIFLKIKSDKPLVRTAQITGIDLKSNKVYYKPVHIFFNEDGRRELVAINQDHICSLDDKMFY